MLSETTPLIIPTFNNPTFTNNFVEQSLSLGFKNIIIYDNNSTYPKMIDLLTKLDSKCRIIRLNNNFGPHYSLRTPEVYESLPELFCLSDPDVEYSKSLPENFLEILLEVSEKYSVGKVGFAIEVPKQNEFLKPYIRMDEKIWEMHEWENQFWSVKIGSIYGNDLYDATLDTQFALYNKNFFDPMKRYTCVRVAGDFTSKHLGLYKETIVPQEEDEFYKNSAKYSYFRGNLDLDLNPVIPITVLEYTKLVEARESLDRNLTRITLERDYFNQELQKVYKSKSWKLLKFLRLIAQKVRQIRGKI